MSSFLKLEELYEYEKEFYDNIYVPSMMRHEEDIYDYVDDLFGAARGDCKI